MKIHRTFGSVMAILALAALPVMAQQEFVIKQYGADPQGAQNITYREATDEYIVNSGVGTYQVARSKVESLSVPRPSDFDKYAQGLKTGGTEGSVAGMEQIVEAFTFRWWDLEGKRLLFPVYERQQQWDKIVKMCAIYSKVKANVPSSIQGFYWRALAKKGGSNNLLLQELSAAIETGSRASAAAAYLVRGDMYAYQGKKQDALIDGYLRVVLMFSDIKDIQPEALYKTYRTLKELNDTRAEKFRKKLVDEFAESDFAKNS